MEIDNFKQMIDTYGALSHRWPSKKQAEGIALLEAEPGAKQYVLKSSQLENWLANYQIEEVPIALRDTIFNSAEYHPQHPLSAVKAIPRSPYVTLLFCAAMGFLLAKTPFLLYLFEDDNSKLFIQFEKMAFQPLEGRIHDNE